MGPATAHAGAQASGTLLIGFGLGASLLAIEVPAARLAKLREGHEAPQLMRDVGRLWAALPTPFFALTLFGFWLVGIVIIGIGGSLPRSYGQRKQVEDDTGISLKAFPARIQWDGPGGCLLDAGA